MRSLHTIYRLFTAPLKPIIFYYVILVKTHIFPSYTWPSRSVLARLHMLFTTCKGIQDRLGFWIPRRGFQIPGTAFQSLVLELGFQSFVGLRVPWVVFRIPWAVFCIPKPRWFGFHKQKFPAFRNLDYLVHGAMLYEVYFVPIYTACHQRDTANSKRKITVEKFALIGNERIKTTQINSYG